MKIPKTATAAILTELKKPLVIDEIELPNELMVGQVLVKVHYSGICGSQLGEINGAKGSDKYLPHLLGHEGSGTVLAIGPGVKYVQVGDIVVMHWRKGLGIEADPPVYRWRDKEINAGWVTTFNNYAVVAENRITAIPSDSELKVAALYGCAVTTGFGVVTNNAKLKIGESIVVYGAGGIGLNIVQAAKLTSGYPIIAVDLHDSKLELAKKMGATHVINASHSNALEEIQSITAMNGIDVFVENTGIHSIIELGYELIKQQGRLVLVGVPRAGEKISIYTLPIHFGKTLIGSHGGEANPQQDIKRYMSLFASLDIHLDELITECIPLSQINKAINGMKDGSIAGRCVIKMDH